MRSRGLYGAGGQGGVSVTVTLGYFGRRGKGFQRVQVERSQPSQGEHPLQVLSQAVARAGTGNRAGNSFQPSWPLRFWFLMKEYAETMATASVHCLCVLTCMPNCMVLFRFKEQ